MRNALSIALFAVAAALLGYAIYLSWDDRNQESAPPAPTSVPGQAQVKTVHDALTQEGLEVEYGKESVRVDELTPVGQELIIDGQPAYVFIFSSTEEQATETADLDPTDLELTDSFGDPVTTEPLTIAAGSNVAVVLTGGDAELAQSVEDAVATIP